jgi:hypothetical protein
VAVKQLKGLYKAQEDISEVQEDISDLNNTFGKYQ